MKNRSQPWEYFPCTLFGKPIFTVEKSLTFISKHNRSPSWSGAYKVTDIPLVLLWWNIIFNFWRWWQSFYVLNSIDPSIFCNWLVPNNVTGGKRVLQVSKKFKRLTKILKRTVCMKLPKPKKHLLRSSEFGGK